MHLLKIYLNTMNIVLYSVNLVYCFGDTSGDAQRLLLVLHTGILLVVLGGLYVIPRMEQR